MATTDMQRLVVALEARTKAFENALNKANGTANRRARAIEGRFAAMNKNVSASMAGVGRQFAGAFLAGASLKGAQDLIDSATRIQNALKVAGLEGENLAKVYDQLFASAQRNAAPIESLVTLYGRAAIVQKELGVSTEELLKFTDGVAVALRVAGTDAQTASGALLQLSQALGAGVVRAEEFNSILEGALPIAQAAAAGLKEAGGSVSELRKLVVDGKVSSEAFFRAFEAGSVILEDKVAGSELTVSQAFVRLQNVLVDVATRFDDTTDASGFLTRAIENKLIPAIEELGKIFSWISEGPIGQFYGFLGDVIDRVTQLSADLGAMTGLDELGRSMGAQPYIGPNRIRERIDGAFAGTTKPAQVTVTKPAAVVQPVSLADYKLPATDKKSKAPKKTAGDRFNEDLQAIRDRTEALKEEQAALGMTFREQEKRAVALDLEQQALADLREEARRKGEKDLESIQLSDQQKAAIDKVAEAYANQAEMLRQATEIQELQRDVLKGALGDVRGALDDGKLGWDDLANVALNALDKIINKIEDDLIDAILRANSAAEGGGFLNWIGKAAGLLFGGASGGGGGGGVDPWGGMREQGGPVKKGKAYIVGEKRPEVFVPDQNGKILPRVPTSAPNIPAIPQSGGSVYSPTLHINADNAQPGVGAEIEAAGKKIMEQMRKEFPINTAKALKTIKRMGYNQ